MHGAELNRERLLKRPSTNHLAATGYVGIGAADKLLPIIGLENGECVNG